MSDLISRQAVMDATKTVMKDTLDSLPIRLEDGEEVYDVRTSELDFILNINKALQNAIKSLPSETHDLRTETHGVCSDELIIREDVIELIEEVCPIYSNDYRFILKDRVKNLPSINLPIKEKCQICPHCEHCDVDDDGVILPSAQPERKKGEWDYSDDMYETRVCSVCGFNTEDYKEYNFCPNCGAEMIGGDNETD